MSRMNIDGAPGDGKLSRPVWGRGKSYDNIKGLPIAIDVKTDLYITSTISKKLNIPERDLWRAIYVSICREICQQVKYGGEPNINLILHIEKLIDEML